VIPLACELPAGSEVPPARWSSSELAAEVVARGICEQISNGSAHPGKASINRLQRRYKNLT
jgi:hypothetical protein